MGAPSDIGDFVIGESQIGGDAYIWQTTPSNQIGEFEIGESQIGTMPFNWQDTVASQYANSPTLLSLINSFNSAVDPTEVIDDWFDNVWNIQTAQGYGLDVWGRIVGVNRVVPIPSGTTYLGFEGSGSASGNSLNQAPFYSGETTTTNYSLSDDAFRQLIMAKAAANIWDGSIPGLNMILNLLFPGQGEVYVTDGLDMTMTYTFSWALTPVQTSIVINSGVLPRPSGVALTIVQA